MTVSSTLNRKEYAGNGVTTAFSTVFPFLSSGDLVVLERNDTTGVETAKTITTHYTVSGGSGSSGTVTMLTAPASGVTLVIYRDPALTQLVDLVNNDSLPVETAIEQPLDRGMMAQQRTRELVERSLRLPEGDTGFTAADMKLPPKVTRAGFLLGFDTDGKPTAATAATAVSAFGATLVAAVSAAAARIVLGVTTIGDALFTAASAAAARAVLAVYSTTETDTAVAAEATSRSAADTAIRADFADTSNAAKGDALVGLKRTDITGTATTLHKYHNERILNLKTDFGAVGDGTADDTTALQNFLTALSTYRIGFIPDGTYKTTASLTQPAETTVFGMYLHSIIKPTSAVTGTTWVQGSGSVLDGIKFDGVNTTGAAIGLSIGDANTQALVNNGITRNVMVARYTGTNAIGLYLRNAVTWNFNGCYFGDGYHGAKISLSGSGAPTSTAFYSCVFKGNSRRGLWHETGYGVAFYTCDFELNGEEGAYVHNGGGTTLHNPVFHNCWFESNQTSLTSGAAQHAAYHMYVRAANPKIRDCFFSTDANSARSIYFESSTDLTIDHPDVRNEAGQIVVDSNSYGSVINWPDSSGDVTSVVTDNGGKTIMMARGYVKFPPTQNANSNVNALDDYEEGTWTPTDASGASLVFSTTVGKYTKIGRMVYWTMEVTYPVTANGSAAEVGGLPFTTAAVGNDGMFTGSFGYNGANRNDMIHVRQSNTSMRFYNGTTQVTNANYSGVLLRASGFYYV